MIIFKNRKENNSFGNHAESFLLSFYFILFIWLIYLLVILYPDFMIKLGVKGRQFEGLKGVLFSPLIHNPKDIFHIINNSFPAFILIYSMFYFYRKIAFKIFILSWIFSGILLWFLAENENSYHIGSSSLIYCLFSFLFFSGVFSKYKPLQSISLFVVFIYGSMVWGIFPLEEKVSWEGHLAGFIIGFLLAIIYYKQTPKPPKFQYEIEKELGIEPPYFEKEWNQIIEDEKSIENKIY